VLSMASEASSFLLPANVAPRHYDVYFATNLKAEFKYEGEVTIEVDVKETTSRVTLHAHELTIHEAKIDDAAVTTSVEADKQFLHLDAAEPLAVGSHRIHIAFQGIHNDKMAGFYRSTTDTQCLGVTQFESTDARRAFPCFDEPALKATFQLRVRAPKGRRCLSNTPISATTEEGEDVTYTFEKTPLLPTYLVAVVVGDLEEVSETNKNGVRVAILATPGKVEWCNFALQVAVKTLDFFAEYFGIPYMLGKCDLVAIPDFGAGAMENAGLVTFRETALLVDPANTSAQGKQRVAYVVAHELAHQWFGNLTTMQWWSDLWLNEGFATWAGWMAVDKLFPEWDTWSQFNAQETAYAMRVDSMRSSHAIQVPVPDPSLISQVFDGLSYSKGAAVIRALEAFMTADKFRDGLRLYLQRHKFANAATEDLWAALAESSGMPIDTIMPSWTRHVGFPVLHVEPAGEDAGAPAAGTRRFRVTQHRFLTTGAPEEEEDAHLWHVPITALAAGDAEGEPKLVLASRSGVLDLPDARWVKLNPGQTGFYRVRYAPALMASLMGALRGGELSTVDRLGLVSDAGALNKAGEMPMAELLELYLAIGERETEEPVWTQVTIDLGEFASAAEEQPWYPLLQRMLVDVYRHAGERLGWTPAEGESHATTKLRPMVLSALAAHGHAATVEECQRQFQLLIKDPTSVPADLRAVVVGEAVRSGGVEAFDQGVALYMGTENPDEKVRYLMALARTSDPALVARYLEWALNPEGPVRGQDVLYALVGIARSRAGRHQGWEYVKSHWAQIEERFKGTERMLSYLSTLPLRGFATAEMADDAEAFFKAHPVPEASLSQSQALESIRTKAAWVQRDGPAAEAWLKSREAAL